MKGALPRPEAAARIASFFGIGVEDLLDDSRELPADALPEPGGVRFARVTGTIQRPDTIKSAVRYMLNEDPPEKLLPEWWDRLPQPDEHAKLQDRVPHVYARMKLAAERSFLGDLAVNNGRTRLPEQEEPLADAFRDLNLQGTGFPSLPGFQTLANVYTSELYLLRSGPLEERVAAQAKELTRQRTMLEEILSLLKAKK